ncbi:Endonuclease/exonuclease/phosphatase [Parasponia andersonii]|uniref:Endonuclease/exonuclease/phosphatase n=1 Tax=Parasponia andersonii TaxID=3476 RepID=A0A2P5D298_PARAD|nr:Endonuclease/exonuclease/phosphatase [Parasponia andersonii]
MGGWSKATSAHIAKVAPNLVFFSETKLAGGLAIRVKFSAGFSHSFVVNSKDRSRGLMLLWNDDWQITINSFSKGHIDSSIQSMDDNCYSNPKPYLCHFSWDLLRRLKYLNLLPWLCGGDFNKILCMSGKSGGNDRAALAMNNFRNTLLFCSLSHLGSQGPDNQDDLSDWDFKFEPYWLREDRCRAVVDKAWNKDALENKLEDLLSNEEHYWRERSHTEWLKSGDRNIGHFHQKATNRMKKNSIKRIKEN